MPTSSASDIERDRAHLIHSLHCAQSDTDAHVWTAGRGAILVDASGREYLDALSGLWNVAIGHGRSELADAAARQMQVLGYASSYAGGTNRPAIELGERLAALCYRRINHFYFTSGGAEANETAFKTARYYWKRRGKPQKTAIISRTWAYHGTTMAAMSATGIASYWPMFEPRVPGFLHIESPYPYRFSLAAQPETGKRKPEDGQSSDGQSDGRRAADLLEKAILSEGPDKIAAFIGEPVQGAGGVIVPQDDYWPRVREICDAYDVLLIADEVITGFGRTGDWFGLSRYGVEPDMVTFAKGITSGYFPLGGVGVSDPVAEAIDSAGGDTTWMHAFTYSGHPVGCAVALANLAIIEREGLIVRARELGALLADKLAPLALHPNVGDVRGIGLMHAVELVADRGEKREFPADANVGARVHAATQRRGMVTRMRGDVYILAPCFVTEPAQIEQMAAILADSIAEVLGD